jgi:hypothetical protein
MRKRSFLMVAGMACIAGLMGLAVAFTDATTSCANAEGNSCVAACRAAHNSCRIASKGSPSCDAQFQACIQGCTRR